MLGERSVRGSFDLGLQGALVRRADAERRTGMALGQERAGRALLRDIPPHGGDPDAKPPGHHRLRLAVHYCLHDPLAEICRVRFHTEQDTRPRSITAKFALVWTSPVLASGQHTLRVRVTGQRHPSASGTYGILDRGEVTDPPGAATSTPGATATRTPLPG